MPLKISIRFEKHTPQSLASYSWGFGDGTTGSGRAVLHAFTSEGTITIALQVTDSKGCAGGSSKSVSITALITALPVCGNSVIDSGESCDGNNCNAQCSACTGGSCQNGNCVANAVCGNLVREGVEECDASSWPNGQCVSCQVSCNSGFSESAVTHACSANAVCGNSVVDKGVCWVFMIEKFFAGLLRSLHLLSY